MKKQFSQIGLFIAVIVLFASCRTVDFQNRSSMSLNEFRLSRSDYKITADASAQAEVKIILGGLIVKGLDDKNIKQARIESVWLGSADEQLAVYELLDKHPEWDYVTNVRFIKSYIQKPFSKTYKTKVIAKGIILNTK